MVMERKNDNGQAALWNGDAGHAWVEAQELLDAMFRPMEALLADMASPGLRVLDVGCGTGSTSLAVSRRLGSAGSCVGIDISAPMIAAARARAAGEGLQTEFLCGDAQRHGFEPARFDLIISRFGVMFFDDSVAAFANLRRAACDGATLRFLAWRDPAENPFMTTAERAAAALLPAMPARRPDEPGQFAFADAERVRQILDESSWAEVSIEPVDIACAFPASGLLQYLTRMGPLGRMLKEADAQTRSHVVETVHAAFNPYVHGNEVRYTAACWNVSARAA
ncbi:class I SAM-dependent methyltransferase [Noviherbaspirillum denitrificans]|uniref:SAM-dependent methyltransferase n=1 Tax=Noviherbaspirillum denitrificans TaxID=1968433 RepID=A0A254TAA0_9BURK|nr:class I SAM-dependent methyltransferase [Noviherbaspirillum denitrificans]OWW19495.1 SAM-dependent methyltransferase [Noviherbaspirillum denitrificans]